MRRRNMPRPLVGTLVLVAWFAATGVRAESPQDAFEQRRAELARESLHFDFDDAVVDDEQSSIVIDHVQLAQDYPSDQLRVEGHCDERGGAEYNLALGERRAEAVKRSLMLLGIAEARIDTVSWGKGRPRATCHDESCWADNRRVDIRHALR
jgi:peptidoglycan-associated lipoprotein